MGRYADIVSAVREAVGDATEPQAQRWVLQASRLLNSRARWSSVSDTIGTTTAGTSAYSVTSSIIDLEAVLVDGSPYQPISPGQYDQLSSGRSTVVGAQYYVFEYTSAGAPQIRLFPTPDESGLAITGRWVKDLATPTWASDDPPYPTDFDYALENMAIAIGKARLDEELADADWFEARFREEIGQLMARKRWRGSKGPVQIGVSGFHF